MTGENDTHRVVRGPHRRNVDGEREIFETGDLIVPTDAELEHFPDQFERVETDDESDEGDADGANDGGEDEASDDDVADAVEDAEDEVERDPIPDELPDDYRELQTLAGEYDIPANQSKSELTEALESRRDEQSDLEAD